MSGTRTMKCTCNHEFQDKEYGKQQRLANISENGKISKCTVCNRKEGSTK